MNLLLDVMSPIPEFSVFDENKIIISIKLPQTQEKKLSDTIIPSYIKINKDLNLHSKMTKEEQFFDTLKSHRESENIEIQEISRCFIFSKFQ